MSRADGLECIPIQSPQNRSLRRYRLPEIAQSFGDGIYAGITPFANNHNAGNAEKFAKS